MFATYVEGAHVDSHSKNKVEFISGTAVVIPASAELPTVILTQSSFAAPTQAGLAVGGEAAGDYDLTKYVKLVTEEGLTPDASRKAKKQTGLRLKIRLPRTFILRRGGRRVP